MLLNNVCKLYYVFRRRQSASVSTPLHEISGKLNNFLLANCRETVFIITTRIRHRSASFFVARFFGS